MLVWPQTRTCRSEAGSLFSSVSSHIASDRRRTNERRTCRRPAGRKMPAARPVAAVRNEAGAGRGHRQSAAVLGAAIGVPGVASNLIHPESCPELAQGVAVRTHQLQGGQAPAVGAALVLAHGSAERSRQRPEPKLAAAAVVLLLVLLGRKHGSGGEHGIPGLAVARAARQSPLDPRQHGARGRLEKIEAASPVDEAVLVKAAVEEGRAGRVATVRLRVVVVAVGGEDGLG
jgi:hypothetical protein